MKEVTRQDFCLDPSLKLMFLLNALKVAAIEYTLESNKRNPVTKAERNKKHATKTEQNEEKQETKTTKNKRSKKVRRVKPLATRRIQRLQAQTL